MVFPRISIHCQPAGADIWRSSAGSVRKSDPTARSRSLSALGCTSRSPAKVDKADEKYFNETIRPLIQGPGVEYIDEINDSEKQAFLGGASALLFPIDWPEPFGLVQIEAMACGTPVIAWRRGSVPEVIEQGVSGFMVEGIDEAVDAVHNIGSLSRESVRERFEERFTIERVAHDYLRVYDSLKAEPNLPVLRRQAA